MWRFISAGQGSGCELVIVIKVITAVFVQEKKQTQLLSFFSRSLIRLWGMILSRASCLCAAWNQSDWCLGLVQRLLRLGLRPNFKLRLNDALNNHMRKPGWILFMCRQLSCNSEVAGQVFFWPISLNTKTSKYEDKKWPLKWIYIWNLCRVQMQLPALNPDWT